MSGSTELLAYSDHSQESLDSCDYLLLRGTILLESNTSKRRRLRSVIETIMRNKRGRSVKETENSTMIACELP